MENKKRNYPVFKGTITNMNFDAIHGMSVVEEPAMEQDFIFLMKHGNGQQYYELAVTEDEKRLITGPALIPDKLVFRNDSKRGKHYITFDAETIEKASHLFLKDFRQGTVTLDHTVKTKNMTVVESWIIEDPEKDKAVALGFTVPKGTWMISMKVDNDEVWSAIKSGKLNGFSIEALFTLVEENASEAEDRKAEELMMEIQKVLVDLEYDDGSMYKWELSGDNPCPACIKWADMPARSGKFWKENAIPGQAGDFPYGPYGTYCEGACRCSLNMQ